jgi:anti-sigma factor RsiW
MESSENTTLASCPSPDISAYIDGELSADAELRLELHFAGCRVCSEDLNLQKSFLNALDSSLEETDAIELPPNFTRSVMTNAESRVSGLRRPHERRNAALICAALIAFSFFALGNNAEKTVAAAASVADKLFAVVGSVSHFFYDVALGSAIVVRSLAAGFIFESLTSVLLLGVLLVLSLWLFSRLLVRFDRT